MKFAEFINRLLRPFSIYKGMSLGLTGIWVAAVVLSFTGALSYSPLALTLSMLVFTLSTYGASVLCGWLFGVRQHGESSLITGLILSLIFIPTSNASYLGIFAFVGFIAGISKFVVTWRGRHIFNPAALAAVVIGVTGLTAATWWVATPVLTPIVLVVILISLYASRRFLVAGVFLAITIPVLLIEFLQYGLTIGQSFWLMMSWPILFLAGVMLVEPLTLPPRKWQMYVEAAIVAIVFLIPVKLGSFQMTPAFAILMGNSVAALFASRYAISLTLEKRKVLTPTTDEFIFKTTEPLKYEPGQYMEITVPHKKMDFRGARRKFSLTSLPNTAQVSFGVKFYEPSSSFKQTLRALKEGAMVRASLVAGDFVVPRDASRPLLLIAGGIGITPFVSHLKSMATTPEKRDVTLVYVVSSGEEIAYKEVLKKTAARIIIVAPEKPKDLPKEWLFSKSARFNFDELSELVPDSMKRWAYISGPIPFVQVGKSKLRKLGVRGVKTDYFAGY